MALKSTKTNRQHCVTSSYQLINILVGLIIVSGFAWLLILPGVNDDYTVECAHVKFTGQECGTCGLTRSFSEMISGDIYSASDYNRNGPLLFVFFVSQFFMRVLAGYSVFRINGWSNGNYKVNRQTGSSYSYQKIPDDVPGRIRLVAVADATISIILFLACFRNLLFFWQ